MDNFLFFAENCDEQILQLSHNLYMDNSPTHNSNLTRFFLNAHCIQTILAPPQSPVKFIKKTAHKSGQFYSMANLALVSFWPLKLVSTFFFGQVIKKFLAACKTVRWLWPDWP